MTFLGFTTSRLPEKNSMSQSAGAHCEAVGSAINSGDIGQTVTAVQQLILRYYDNVREQADESFMSAKRVAWAGFVLFCLTVFYVMFMDLMPHIRQSFFISPLVTGGSGAGAEGTGAGESRLGVGAIGLIGGAVVEVIAGVQFWLYGRATRQFGAFHICLERTHRYLLAYEMTQGMTTSKETTLEKIVCIMANAPMITREDIEGVESGATLGPEISPANALRSSRLQA